MPQENPIIYLSPAYWRQRDNVSDGLKIKTQDLFLILVLLMHVNIFKEHGLQLYPLQNPILLLLIHVRMTLLHITSCLQLCSIPTSFIIEPFKATCPVKKIHISSSWAFLQ